MTQELIANILGVRREGGLRPAANKNAAIFSLSRWNR
jgi:hypothetical protein